MKTLLFLLATCIATLPATRAAEPIHVFITGETSGEIQGGNPDQSIACLAFEHTVVSLRDAASGLPTGKRQHKPLTIVKPIDKTTPLLYAALCRNENLPEVVIQFYHPPVAGEQPTPYYTITLHDARISSVRNWKPNTRDLSADRAGDLEEVSFGYQRITWTFNDGNVEWEDDWESPDA